MTAAIVVRLFGRLRLDIREERLEIALPRVRKRCARLMSTMRVDEPDPKFGNLLLA
jgi:hypothetical protein